MVVSCATKKGVEEEAASAPVPVRVVDGVADELHADDAAFDADVALLVLCSVPGAATEPSSSV